MSNYDIYQHLDVKGILGQEAGSSATKKWARPISGALDGKNILHYSLHMMLILKSMMHSAMF